jgi:hypothetical protein
MSSIKAGKVVINGIDVQTDNDKDQTVINTGYKFDPNKTYLVVNGKVKEISPKSKYLLDMLIIDK